MKGKGLIGAIVGVAFSVAVLSVTVYYAGRAWKKSQTGEKLV